MEPDRQLEIQLGHMCNNRCVFCVSGQRTEMREAFPIAGDPIVERLQVARESGIRKLTLLGGEPTIQPDFMRIVRSAVQLAFEEIVVFTNGVKTARASFVDEVLATGGNFTFRLSFQGATARAHDRTTKKLGSFQRLVETMKNLRARGQRITVNMCVVESNYESVSAFPALLVPYQVEQLHLDMVRPLDAGVRTEDEMRAMLPRYTDLVPHLEAMARGFPESFDLNIGNVPYCIAPGLAPVIHHDGETTLTVSVDDRDELSEPWDKYQVKRRDKVKTPECGDCVFDDQCSGVFDTYRRFYGTSELRPITRARLPVVDPERRLFTLHAAPWIEALRRFVPRAPFTASQLHVDSRAQQLLVTLAHPEGSVRVALRRPGGGAASTDLFSLHVVSADVPGDARADAVAVLRDFFAHATSSTGARAQHSIGDDAFERPRVDRRIARCIERLRSGAPYASLTWEGVAVGQEGSDASVVLRHVDGTGVTVSVSISNGRVQARYALDRPVAEPPASLVEGVRAAFTALRG